MSYYKSLKRSLTPPKFKKVNKERVTSPLELFFDLLFVGALASIGHFFIEPTAEGVLIALILYFAIYSIWVNIVYYQFYFFSSSYYTRFLLLIVMLPMLFITGLSANSHGGFNPVIIAFALTRFALAAIWVITMLLQKIDDDKVHKKVSFDIFKFIISALIALIGLYLGNKLTMIITALTVEVIISIFVHRRYFKDQEIIPDLELEKERHILFLLLVWGEGVVVIISTIGSEMNNILAIVEPIIVFLTIYLFFVRFYDEYMTLDYSQDTALVRTINHAPFGITNLILFTSLGQVVISPKTFDFASAIVVFIVLFYITTWHTVINVLAQIKCNHSLRQFYQLDFIFLILMYLFSLVSLLTYDKPLIYLIIIFLYFLVHVLAMPLRYLESRKKIHEQVYK